MRGGVIGVAREQFQVVDSFSDSAEDGDLRRTLDVERVFSLPSGTPAFEGRAAVEQPGTRATPELDYGEIRVTEREETETRVTDVAGVPGEFVVAGSGSGTFAFDLVERDTGAGVERATFDLDGFLDAHPAADAWRAGFYDGDGNADTGVLHGTDLLADDGFGDVVRRANLNQLGLDYAYDGDDVKMTGSESGYVELYQPTAFDTADFLQYLLDEVLPHLE